MTQEPEKMIIVDEDWKSQVEREREAASQTAGGTAAKPAKVPPGVELPPPSLAFLISSLYSQTLLFLGLMPHPATGKAEKNFPVARHTIDLLEILQQKTEGNRTPEESDLIEEMLHQLRMAYVQATGEK
jgi:hypothetical protein